jgi:hypothetical protein
MLVCRVFPSQTFATTMVGSWDSFAGHLLEWASLLVALLSVAFSWWLQRRTRALERLSEKRDSMEGFEKRLVMAAHNLQTRLYKITDEGFFVAFAHRSPEDQRYAMDSTLYLFATYFGILNIMREGVQHLEQTNQRKTYILEHTLDHSAAALATDVAQPAPRLNRRRSVLELTAKGRCTLAMGWLGSLLTGLLQGCRKRCCTTNYDEQIDVQLREGKGALKKSVFVKQGEAGTSKWQVFREEQQAIGDLIISRSDDDQAVGAGKPTCIGYAEFLFKLRKMETATSDFEAKIQKDVSAMKKLQAYIKEGFDIAQGPESDKGEYTRLQFFQNLLVDILDVLDPGHSGINSVIKIVTGQITTGRMHQQRQGSWYGGGRPAGSI